MFVAVRLEVDALPKNDVAAEIEVKIGLGETAIVEVAESEILEPAIK